MMMAMLILAAASLAALCGRASAQEGSAPVASGKIASIEGEVTVIPVRDNPEKKTFAAETGRELFEGDFIVTGFESNCVVELADKSKLTVQELSKLQINKFTSEAKRVDGTVTLYNGTVRASISKQTDRNTDFRVKTPVSTISVRGTEKIITTAPGFGTTVSTIAGVVEVTNMVGQSVTVKKGEDTSVASGAEPPERPSDMVGGRAAADLKNSAVTKDEKKAMRRFKRPLAVPDKFNSQEIFRRRGKPAVVVIDYE